MPHVWAVWVNCGNSPTSLECDIVFLRSTLTNQHVQATLWWRRYHLLCFSLQYSEQKWTSFSLLFFLSITFLTCPENSMNWWVASGNQSHGNGTSPIDIVWWFSNFNAHWCGISRPGCIQPLWGCKSAGAPYTARADSRRAPSEASWRSENCQRSQGRSCPACIPQTSWYARPTQRMHPGARDITPEFSFGDHFGFSPVLVLVPCLWKNSQFIHFFQFPRASNRRKSQHNGVATWPWDQANNQVRYHSRGL